MLPFPQAQMQVIITLRLARQNLAICTLLAEQTVLSGLHNWNTGCTVAVCMLC